MEEICAAKDTELAGFLQKCSRLENELASVRKVRKPLIGIDANVDLSVTLEAATYYKHLRGA